MRPGKQEESQKAHGFATDNLERLSATTLGMPFGILKRRLRKSCGFHRLAAKLGIINSLIRVRERVVNQLLYIYMES